MNIHIYILRNCLLSSVSLDEPVSICNALVFEWASRGRKCYYSTGPGRNSTHKKKDQENEQCDFSGWPTEFGSPRHVTDALSTSGAPWGSLRPPERQRRSIPLSILQLLHCLEARNARDPRSSSATQKHNAFTFFRETGFFPTQIERDVHGRTLLFTVYQECTCVFTCARVSPFVCACVCVRACALV